MPKADGARAGGGSLAGRLSLLFADGSAVGVCLSCGDDDGVLLRGFASGGQANFDGNYPYGGGRKGKYLEKTVKVGSYELNAWGLYDLHENVWEWCYDWKGECPKGEVIDPTGPPSGQYRVLRGGSCYSDARICRSAARYRYVPSARSGSIGFRLSLRVQTSQKR